LCIFSGDTYYHLWFMYSLAGVYLAMPFFSHLTKLENSRLLTLAVILYFTIGVFLPFLADVGYSATGRDFRCGIACPPFTGFMGFGIVGFALTRVKQSPRRRFGALAILILSTSTTISLTFFSSLEAGTGVETHFVYLNPLVACSACCCFYLLMLDRIPPQLSLIASRVSQYSFGIYLIHPLIIDGLKYLRFPSLSVLSGPLSAIIVVILSLLTCQLMYRLKFFRSLVM
ncbi:MAG: acyltransferase family protein, partial [Planctomycetaceae bacterium]|nr:acyltransferase family protein [Planctomycetaceae bacterium]